MWTLLAPSLSRGYDSIWISGTLMPPSPEACHFCQHSGPHFCWSIMGIQLGLIDGHSGLAPLATFTPSLHVHWDCVPFVSGLTCENKHNPKTRLVSAGRVVGPFPPRSLGVHKGGGRLLSRMGTEPCLYPGSARVWPARVHLDSTDRIAPLGLSLS